jgi:PAS domain S-box-containing protein
MDLHPGPEKSRVPERAADSDPIRRALHENEDWYQDLVEHSQDLLCVHDLEGRLLSMNPAPARVLGYSVEELLQIPMREIIAPEFRPQFDAYLNQIARVGESRGLMTVLTRSGERRIWEYHNTLRTEGVASPIVRGMAHDVTEQKRAEKLLREASEAMLQDISERRRVEERLREYERVVEGLEEMIVAVDRDYRYVIANRSFLNHRGMVKEQVLGRRVDEVVYDEAFQSVVKPKLDECFQGKAVEYEMKYTYPKLGERDLLISYFPIEGPTGVDRIACILRDITERKRAEETLRDAKEFSENLIRTANVIILSLDMGGNVTLFNQAAEEITGYTFAELKGKNWSILVSRDRFPHVWEEFDRLVAGTASQTFENPILTKTGEERYIAWRNNPVKVNGRAVATISFGNDITQRRRAEEALRRSEENYRLFISQSSEGIFREDLDAPVPIDLPEDELIHHILYDSYLAECNEAIVEMYGLSSVQEFVGKRLTEMLPPEDPHNIELTRQYIRSGFRVLDRESHEVDIHGNPKVFLNSMIGIVENGMLVRTWGIQRDVTEKVK